MYALIDGLCFIAGIAGFIAALAKSQPVYLPLPIAWLLLYSLLNEALYNLAAAWTKKVRYDPSPNSRLVYHPSYNISFCGIEKLHPFDSQKYGNILRKLLEKGVIRSMAETVRPNKVGRRLLLEKMSKLYLLKLCYSVPLSSYIEMPLCFLPNFLLRWRVLDPMLYAT